MAKTTTSPKAPQSTRTTWQQAIAPYTRPVTWRSVWQVINSVIPYLALWYLMYLSLGVSYWLTLGLAVLASGFLMRSFIILHDCGHGAFFKSQKANDILGFLIGILTFTPYYYWRHDHAVHHASAGDLDRRSVGDIWTLTVKEYAESSFWRRFGYRLYRNPLVMFLVGPLFVFLLRYRLPLGATSKRERLNVHYTNLAILGIVVIMAATIGLQAYVLVQLPITMISTAAGVWMFYVQHQFEEVYWERHENWDYVAAALDGSSFYKLPKVLQWFTGNIGFHHIHHLSPRIPNYQLSACYRDNPIFQEIEPITLKSSLKSLTFRLWDEEQRKLVGYAPARDYRQRHVVNTT
ncbi:MAG: fatty acid desaturase [Calditrichaeota bacterium]|nr:MAG: fatty acid desaturase [Calditrichota bacterium]